MTNIWEIITVVSIAIQAMAVVIAIAYAANELRSAAKDRDLAIVTKIDEIFNEPKARAARRHIFNELPPEPGKLSREDYEMARHTWNLMNLIGVYAHYSLASREMILELYSQQVARLWHKLEPHILYYRMERGNFAAYFEELAKMSLEYRRKHYGEDEPHIYRVKSDKTSEGVAEPHLDND